MSVTFLNVDLGTMRVNVPEGTSGAIEIRRFTVDDNGSLVSFLTGQGRGTPPGQYSALCQGGTLWMSDTPDECRDHIQLITKAREYDARRVLINGLGLGVAINALIRLTPVCHIDVVEIDPDIIALVAPHYADVAAACGKTVQVHTGDAYTYRWPRGTRWDIAWHDVWPYLCVDNLADMARLHRRYGARVVWQDSWGRDLCRRRRDRDKKWGPYGGDQCRDRTDLFC